MSVKPLPGDLLQHLHELTGNELKIWIYYYLRSGDELTCYSSNDTVESTTGLSLRTIKVCKRNLIARGWLHYTGDSMQPRNGGQYAVPVLR